MRSIIMTLGIAAGTALAGPDIICSDITTSISGYRNLKLNPIRSSFLRAEPQ